MNNNWNGKMGPYSLESPPDVNVTRVWNYYKLVLNSYKLVPRIYYKCF